MEFLIQSHKIQIIYFKNFTLEIMKVAEEIQC